MFSGTRQAAGARRHSRFVINVHEPAATTSEYGHQTLRIPVVLLLLRPSSSSVRPTESPLPETLPETARPPPMKTTFAAAGGFILGMERVTD